MSDPYDKIRHDVASCEEELLKELELGIRAAVVGPNGPTIKSEPVWRWL
jgi:hypothetical protein